MDSREKDEVPTSGESAPSTPSPSGGRPLTAHALGAKIASALQAADSDAPLGDPALALNVLEQAKWPEGPQCPACLSSQHYRVKDRPGRFQCTACKKGYSIRGGTPLEGSIVALDIWACALRKWSDGVSFADIQSTLAADRMTPDLARRFVNVLRSRVETAPQSLPEFTRSESALTARFVQVGVAPAPQSHPSQRWLLALGLVAGWILVIALSVSGGVSNLHTDAKLRISHLGTVKYMGERQYLTMIGDRRSFYTPIDPEEEDPEVTKERHLQDARELRLIMLRRNAPE
tara:strand:+ start:14377 stop:15243 length:867 start_codon:yes stop_codon:yes gene_type:complete